MAADEGKKVRVMVTFMDRDSYTVVLDTQPTASVTVAVGGHSGTDGTPNPTTLTFTTSNWNTDRTVTVTDNDSDNTLEIGSNGELRLVNDYGPTTLVDNIAPQFACQQMGERSEDLDFRIWFGGERLEAADAEPEHRSGVRVSVHW